MTEKGDENYLRGDGKLPVILAEGETLAHAARDAVIKCYKFGARTETPKHRAGVSLGYDADIIVKVNNPTEAPQIYSPVMWDGPETLMQYILEVTHGIHNNWKKSPEHPDRWGYTYNERFFEQLPFVFAKIKKDFEKKGHISSRQYQFAIWRAGEDVVPEQPDPPCLQRGHLRFLQDNKREWVLNYCTDWRSRCLFKAWNSNNVAQIELMKLIGMKVSDMLGIPIRLGVYSDRSSSLHLYGLYFDKENIGRTIEETIIPNKKPELYFRSLDDYFYDKTQVKRLVAAQKDAADKGLGKQLNEDALIKLGYDTDTFSYPLEWDSWPKSWDAEPDYSKLARVYSDDEIVKRARQLLGLSKEDFEKAVATARKESNDWFLSHDNFME